MTHTNFAAAAEISDRNVCRNARTEQALGSYSQRSAKINCNGLDNGNKKIGLPYQLKRWSRRGECRDDSTRVSFEENHWVIVSYRVLLFKRQVKVNNPRTRSGNSKLSLIC